MARPLCSCMLLVVLMAVSSSNVLDKRNRRKTTIVPTPPGPPADIDVMEPISNNAAVAELPLLKGPGLQDRYDSDVNCSERANCKSSPDYRYFPNCFCDDLCETFDDCCQDYVRHPNSSIETLDLPPEVVSCQSLFDGSTYLVVTRCPANCTEPYFRKNCELGNSADADFFYRLPVNGRKSKVLYRNIYCAICNNDSDVIYWMGQRDACHGGLYDQQPIDSHNTTIEALIAKNSHCKTSFVNPNGYDPRFCREVRRQCSANWTDRETARKCEERLQLNSYVHHEGLSMTFRNKHCAICNHLTEAEMNCIVLIEHPQGARPPLIPFTILVDFNAKTQAIRNNYNELEQTMQTVELRECDPGFVYDPFAKVCRLVFCPKSYQPTDVSCEPTPDFRGPQTNLSCSPIIQLNESEFIVLSNQSAYVYAMDLLYTEDQYAQEPPYLYICAPFTRQYNVTLLVMFQFDHIQSVLSFVGVIVSLMSLLILFVIYMIFPELRNTPGKCIVCLVVSLFVGQLAFLFVAHEGPVCFYLAAAMHFGFLAAFFWMNALAFDIFRTFTVMNSVSLSTSRSKWKRFVAYSVFAWLIPALIVGICITMDVLVLNENFRPHYGEGVCWITSQTALLVFFAVPVGVILIVNVVFFCVTIHCICWAAHAAQAATPKTHPKGLLLICIKLLLIMGLTWLFGFMASLTEWTALWYVFIVFNSLQGTFLCLIFLCTMKVYRMMKTKWSTKSRNSTTAPQNNQKASTTATIASKDEIKVVAKETCM